MNLKKAVALKYAEGRDKAPAVAAKGSGLVAEAIIEKAMEHAVPVQEDPSLVTLLEKLEIQEEIPEELYQAVAEIFAFIYKMENSLP
ncbi:EscU/YscU/HrcU family type III secretion system export apparatus switch protein [Metabacillus sp. GX 13764]|uniref:EscU/YscU/HrcU family type III secretion system export apparatus switch protein n=1 Tax=Metabacillus kandeliae TaxID=2900151 RepID=UPI001E579D53|nr:EscU/YscU/HrcU family type III secretion system export apparatus switch protein [Metabacillus kandeliae]MCD7033797.1 EscU/YscU/HrcU family type III secretion system export apparatus switch protein [Metabacillus kandeliae]